MPGLAVLHGVGGGEPIQRSADHQDIEGASGQRVGTGSLSEARDQRCFLQGSSWATINDKCSKLSAPYPEQMIIGTQRSITD